MTAIPPEVALPLILDRARRLADDVRTGRPVGGIAAAIDGIADDLADVVAQLTPAVTP